MHFFGSRAYEQSAPPPAAVSFHVVVFSCIWWQDTGRVLKSLCDREYVWEHGNMTENFSDECALREFIRI